MKKILVLIIAFMLVLSTSVFAGGGKVQVQNPNINGEPQQPEQIQHQLV